MKDKKLKKYYVTWSVDASVTVNVLATSKKEAIAKSTEDITPPSLCHHCSRTLSIGDIGEVIEAGEE